MTDKRYISQQTGYTLIEVLLYVAFVTVALSGIISFTFFAQRVQSKIRVDRITMVNTSDSLQRVRQVMREAVVVDVAQSTLNTDQSVLVLTMPETYPVDETRLFIENGQLMMIEGDNSFALSGDDVAVDRFLVTSLSSGGDVGAYEVTLETRFDTESPKPYLQSTSSMSTIVYLRNSIL
jgi:hypothetical protein